MGRWLTIVAAASGVCVIALCGLLAITPFVDRRRQRILRRCLRDICDVLNAHDVDYWCDYGTLLGYFRDQDIIRTDYDVDLCMLDRDKARLMTLAPVFKAKGYTLTDRGGRQKRLVRITDDRTGYYADLYPFVPDGAVFRSTFRTIEDTPAELVGERVTASFLGTTIRVPRNTEALLLHRYGPTFRVPRRGDQGLAYANGRLDVWMRILENDGLGLLSMLRSLTKR